MIVLMPHCGAREHSTSGGEVVERELLRRLPGVHIYPLVRQPKVRGLRWWNSMALLGPSLALAARTYRPRLIRAHSLRYTGLPALLVGRRAGIKVTVHSHHLDGDRLAWLDRFVLRHADQVITDSAFSAQQILAASGRPAIVVRLGVDHNRFHFTPMPEGRIVLLVGGRKARKNTRFVHDLWPKVRARVPGAILMEMGEGAAVSDATVAAYYSAARVVAMPSRLEGFGLPVLEAMASQRPVVCSDRGALPELAIHTTPLEAELWIERLTHLLTDDDAWEKEARAQVPVVREYTWTRTVAELAHAWRRLAA